MPKFYVKHIDSRGEAHVVGDVYDAISAEDAIATILEQNGEEDDGGYFADRVPFTIEWIDTDNISDDGAGTETRNWYKITGTPDDLYDGEYGVTHDGLLLDVEGKPIEPLGGTYYASILEKLLAQG